MRGWLVPVLVGGALLAGCSTGGGGGGGPATSDVGQLPPTTEFGGGDGSSGGYPTERGDDAALDASWDRCAQGWGEACDQLFDAAAPGTDYERFALSCGERTREARCADVYPSPGVTLPSPAQVSTTEPPPSP